MSEVICIYLYICVDKYLNPTMVLVYDIIWYILTFRKEGPSIRYIDDL